MLGLDDEEEVLVDTGMPDGLALAAALADVAAGAGFAPAPVELVGCCFGAVAAKVLAVFGADDFSSSFSSAAFFFTTAAVFDGVVAAETSAAGWPGFLAAAVELAAVDGVETAGLESLDLAAAVSASLLVADFVGVLAVEVAAVFGCLLAFAGVAAAELAGLATVGILDVLGGTVEAVVNAVVVALVFGCLRLLDDDSSLSAEC